MFYAIIEKHFEEAIRYYTKAIELNPTVAVYYGNRSFTHMKMESYGFALSDANKALELDKTYVKVNTSPSERERVCVFVFFFQGYYRRASANMALGKFKLALRDFETVKKSRPRDPDAQVSGLDYFLLNGCLSF